MLLERRIGFLPLRHPREATDRDAALDLLRKRIEQFLVLLVEFLPEFRSFTAYPADEPPEAANQVIDTPPKRSDLFRERPDRALGFVAARLLGGHRCPVAEDQVASFLQSSEEHTAELQSLMRLS